MPHLSLTFLGGFAATLDGQPLTTFGTDKVRALLAYVAVESGRPHQRSALAALFWPDLPPAKAGHNLSQTLVRLRRALNENMARQPLVLITSQNIQFNSIGDWQLDVARFTDLLAAIRQHAHSQAETCRTCMTWLAQAAELYRGDFLAGFILRDNTTFEEWQLVQQEALRRQAIDVFSRLVTYSEIHNEPELVRRYAEKLVTLDPWHEQGLLKLMRVLALNGQAAAAVERYVSYSRILTEEFGILPPAEVTALFKQIQAGQIRPETGGASSVPAFKPGERRQITALVCSRWYPAGPIDPEELHQHMTQCGPRCQQILDRYGGHRQQHHGDGCLIYFGYPQSYEDTARRAVHAGLALTAAGQEIELVRVGIHTGIMVVGGSSGSSSTSPEPIGDVPGVARSCSALAEPGSVVMTENTERLVRGWFDYQSLGEQHLTNEQYSLELHRVRGASAEQRRLAWLAHVQHLTPLVGRGRELKQMAADLTTAAQGRGQIITLRGESGIGKSRLVWELRQIDVSSAVWLESGCLPYFQNTSLYPMVKLLEQLLGFADEDSPEIKQTKLDSALTRYDLSYPAATWLMALLLELPTDRPAPAMVTVQQRERMREIFVALVQKQAAEQPLVLVIEDLHWADPSSIDWLVASLDALTTTRCLILLTYRPSFNPPWLPGSQLHSLDLMPLSQTDVKQMVAQLTDQTALPDEICRRIVDQSDGTPLFVEELSKMLIEAGARVFPRDIPTTLRDSLLARLDRVGAARETAGWAAALGRDFAYSILAAVVPYDEQRLQADLTTLIGAELVSVRLGAAEALYSFKHALIQEAAHASLLKRTSQNYHRHIAETYTARFPHIAEAQPEILAQHYSQADLPNQAVDYWLRAGDHATAQGATQEARTFFDRALALIEPTDCERRWRAVLAREAVLNLREERAAQSLDVASLLELAEALDDDTRRVEALLRQATYANLMEDFQLMLQASEAAVVAAARHGNLALEVMALSRKIVALARLERWEAARLLIDEVLAKLPEVKDEAIQYYGLSALGMYYSDIGDLAHSLQLALQSVEIARRVGERSRESGLLANVGLHYAKLGLYALARAGHEQGLVLAEVVGDRRLQTNHRYDLCYVLWCSGDRDNARALGERALRELRTSGYRPHGIASCLTYLGLMYEDARDYIVAAAYLKESRALLVGLSLHGPAMEVQAIEARCLLALGQPEDARQLAVEVWSFIKEHGTRTIDFPARVYLCLADVVAQVLTVGVTERDVLDAGYAELRQRAEMINDPEWRRSFIEDEVSNKALIARWQRIKDADLQRNTQG